jgi:hypothetical protein
VARICDTETAKVGGFPIYAPSMLRANGVWPVRGGPGIAPYVSLENLETHQRRDLLASSTRSAIRTISMILSV